MALPSGLPALNDALKKLDSEAGNEEAENLLSNNNNNNNTDCRSKKQSNISGLNKPPRSGSNNCCKPAPGGVDCNDINLNVESRGFREELQRGVPIDSGKRSVFAFGLSDEQEDALFQYITNKTTKRPPGYEPDRDALADCWGSPEPERQDDDDDDDVENALQDSQPPISNFPAGESEPLGDCSGEQNEVDVASSESLYEGEGGVDLGSRSPGGVTENIIGNNCCNKHRDGSDLDRDLILQKVKECYGLGVRTSALERVMRKDHLESQSPSALPQSSTGMTIQTSNIMVGSSSSPGKMASSPSELSDCNDEEDGGITDESNQLWEDECMRYLERAPEFRARLQYEVRVILISPAFRSAGRTVTAFARLYEKRFGRTVNDAAGFSTAARLCRSMPHVVQRALLIDEGKLRLVDTPKNHRIVAGIRSGLRRIVYDVLRSQHQSGIAVDAVESLLERVIGVPLQEVLMDHGYQATSASVECLLRDMPDLVFLDERAAQTRAFLCNGAQDPALTDGILIQRSPISPEALVTTGVPQLKRRTPSCSNSDDQNLQEEESDVADSHLPKSPPGPRMGPNGMAPEELSDLRVLCAAESSSPYRDASLYSVEDMSPHARLRFRLLLALHDEGRGIRVEDLPGAYEKMFGVALDVPSLGLDSLQELIDTWQDDGVLLVKASAPGWVFPINTLENNRILNTITSGLRSAVFAILLARYPEGLPPLDLAECLEETLSGKLWDILRSNGYIFKDMSKTTGALCKGKAEFQLAECPELRLLLKDMEDFVRLGSQEDGALIVKLRDGEFPLLDLLDCEVSEDASAAVLEGGSSHSPTKEDSDMIVPVPKINLSPASQPVVTEGELKRGEEFAAPSTSPVAAAATPGSPSLKLQQEIRMIFGSPEYMENGLTVDEFYTVYRDRTGKALQLGEFKSTEALLHAMPDVVGTDANDQMITLVQSGRNMRILSVTKVGLRQVLFWALLKNPGGVWAELLEGWYVDFAEWPLSNALAAHGYEKPRRTPLQPVCEFLQDMADLLEVDVEDPHLYRWRGLYEDPILADASLLGMSVDSIQYDPMNEDMKNTRWHMRTMNIAKAATQLQKKVDPETTTTSHEEKTSALSGDDCDDAGMRDSTCAMVKCLATLDANEANCPGKKNLVESILNTPPTTLCQS